ncbi:MAG: hypothetical protein V9G22_15815 [Ottowia sp.]
MLAEGKLDPTEYDGSIEGIVDAATATVRVGPCTEALEDSGLDHAAAPARL